VRQRRSLPGVSATATACRMRGQVKLEAGGCVVLSAFVLAKGCIPRCMHLRFRSCPTCSLQPSVIEKGRVIFEHFYRFFMQLREERQLAHAMIHHDTFLTTS
jgi:hypothetical protein